MSKRNYKRQIKEQIILYKKRIINNKIVLSEKSETVFSEATEEGENDYID